MNVQRLAREFWAAASDGSLYNYAASCQGQTPGFPGTNSCLKARSAPNGTALLYGGCDASAAEFIALAGQATGSG